LLAGFGPRKGRLFKKCLADAVTSRAGFAELIARFLHRPAGKDPMTSPVVVNCMPFIKICPDLRDTWDVRSIRGFDRCRLSEPFHPWVTSLCREALKLVEGPSELDDDETPGSRRRTSGDALAQAIHEHSRRGNMERILQEVNLDEWQDMAGIAELPSYADLDALLTMLIPEVLEPFKDQRQDFSPLDDQTAFYLIIGDSEDNFSMGSVVHTVVKLDSEFTGDDAKAARTSVSVDILPSMVRGSFRKMHKLGRDHSGYVAGCKRKFEQGESVIARIVDIRTSSDRPYNVVLSVDMDEDLWSKQFPIQDEDAPFFVPFESENWTKIKLGLINTSAVQQKEALKDWVRRPRNIRHTNWSDADHNRALEIIDNYPMGNVLFRPSRRHDIIVAMLKVRNTAGEDAVDRESCFRTFDIIEKTEKTVTKGFEIAKDLECDGCLYNNFDEVIARHMDPIMENLRLLQEHPRYGLGEGGITDRYQVREAIASFTKQDRKMLHYVLLLNDVYPGHGLLLWALGGQKPREEFIEVTPGGYSLWLSRFETIQALIQWFKTVGWRNSTRCRQDFKEAWAKRRAEAAARRGPDAFADRPRTQFKGWAPDTTKSGLQTPSAAAGTPTFYGMESAAPTPSGLATPAGGASGYRTPDPRMVPGSPAPMKMGGLSTPRGAPMTPTSMQGTVGSAPRTPAGLLASGQSARGRGHGTLAVPGTPTTAFAPGTPAGLAALGGPRIAPGQGSRGGGAQRVPQTPLGLNAAGARGFAPQTPAGLGQMPATPAPPHVPATPAGVAPMSPARIGGQPRTPAGPVPHSPGGPVPQTPAGPVPSTPAGAPR